jgi:hypothetical protein
VSKLIVPPPPQPLPVQTDIQLFAKAYFNIDLTSYQIKVIAMVAAGKPIGDIHSPKSSGKTTANKVILAYLQAGLSPHGRARLPQHPLPPRPAKLKGVTQEGKILAAIKRSSGAYNWELSRIALKYTSVISSLRKDGHDIIAHRQYNKKGKATDTWLYTCYE